MNKPLKPGKVQRLLRCASRAILTDACGPYPSRSEQAEQVVLSLSLSIHCSDCPLSGTCHVLKDTHEDRTGDSNEDCREAVRWWLNE